MRCYNCPNVNIQEDMGVFNCIRKQHCLFEDITRRNEYKKFNIHKGSKILFKGQKRYWTVVSCDNRFVICIRNWRKTYHYTICDLQDCIREADNYDSSGGYYDYKEDNLTEALNRLHSGDLQISYRNWTTLDIENVKDK